MKTPLTDSQRWCLRVFAIFFIVTMMQVRCAPARPQQVPVPPAIPVEEDAFTDTQPDGGVVPVPSPFMPETPLGWQKVPPCDPDAGEVVKLGACYLPIDQRPPCARKLVQYEGKCYRTIPKPKPQPVSGEQ